MDVVYYFEVVGGGEGGFYISLSPEKAERLETALNEEDYAQRFHLYFETDVRAVRCTFYVYEYMMDWVDLIDGKKTERIKPEVMNKK